MLKPLLFLSLEHLIQNLDITDYLPIKMQLVSVYEEEMRQVPHSRSPQHI